VSSATTHVELIPSARSVLRIGDTILPQSPDDTRRTLRGISRGLVLASRLLTPVLLVGSWANSWAIHLLGLHMTRVGLVGPPFPAEWVRQGFLPEGTPELTWQNAASVMPDGTVLLPDGRTTAEILHLADQFSVKAVLGTTMGRRLLFSNGWSGHQQPIHHHLVGGVTTFCSIITLHHKEHCTYPDLENEVGRDASTIRRAVNRSFHYRLAPSLGRVVPLALVNLGYFSSPVFHGGGLLPGHLSLDTRMLTPTIFQRQGFWGMRTLTWEELLSSLDVSELAQSHIPFIREICHALRPGNFLHTGWNRFNGGVIFNFNAGLNVCDFNAGLNVCDTWKWGFNC
jgi:hypothetical protein